MSEDFPVQKYALYTLAALGVGGAIWYLSRDAITYDKTAHTKENLDKIVNEIFLEHATAYCSKLTKILDLKKDGNYSPEMKEQLKKMQAAEMNALEQEIYKEHGLTEAVFTEWLLDQKDDTITKKFRDLELIRKSVFPDGAAEPSIMHIECEDKPQFLEKYKRSGEEINKPRMVDVHEDAYIYMYRKQHAKLRFEIFKVRVAHGKPQRGSTEDQRQREELTNLIKKKPEYLQAVWDMYGVQKVSGDKREPTVIMKELYLDFLSKSLNEMVDYNRKKDSQYASLSEDQIKEKKLKGEIDHVVVFSKRYSAEQTQHNQILEQLITEDPDKFKKVYRNDNTITEGGNGLADIMIDPMETYEKKIPTAQADLVMFKHHQPVDFHFKMKKDKDGKNEVVLVDQKTIYEKDDDAWEDVKEDTEAPKGEIGDEEPKLKAAKSFHFK